MTLSEEDILALEALTNAATPSPWQSPQADRYGEVVAPEAEKTPGYEGFLVAESCMANNARFIAMARTAIPQLLARVREIEKGLRLVTATDCCGCSIFHEIAEAALTGEPLPEIPKEKQR